jgi:hypothetical protein
MGSHVVGTGNELGVNTMLGLVFDFERWVEGPERSVSIEVLG